MAEEEVSDTGHFHALSAVDPATSYSTSGTGSFPSPGTGATAQAAPPPAQPAPVNATDPSARPPTMEEIRRAISAANANLAASGRVLDYRVDAATGISIALIRNSQTGVVLQQMPGADIIALARMLAGWAPGKHMMLDLIA